MSENKDQQPMTQTSAVPIRKETVRVTLKAPPQGGTGPTAPPAPMAPPAPSAPLAPTPAPTVPLRTPGAPTGSATPAPTVPLRTPGAPTGPAIPAPAPTVKLNTGMSSGPATKLATPSASQPLPKATVQLSQTQPMDGPQATPLQAATVHRANDEDFSSNKGGGFILALSIITCLVAGALLAIQVLTANIWAEGDLMGSLFG